MPNTAVTPARAGRNPAVANPRSSKAQYRRLLTGFAPVVIETRSEHRRALKTVEALMEKRTRTRAETSLLKLLSLLVEDYEQRHYSLGEASPLETLRELMAARDLQPKHLWETIGSKGVTSEVLNGKRGMSNEMARRLGEFFHVSPEVFIGMRSGKQ